MVAVMVINLQQNPGFRFQVSGFSQTDDRSQTTDDKDQRTDVGSQRT
jgi:hypothetical protein